MTEQRMVPVELLEEICRDIRMHTDATCSSIGRGVLNDLHAIIDGPGVEPVAEWVKADYGDYPVLKWSSDYAANIGDKFYLAAPRPPAK